MASHAATASGGEADDEPARVVRRPQTRTPATAAKRGREDGEEDPERVPLHAPSVLPYAKDARETRSVHWPTGTGA